MGKITVVSALICLVCFNAWAQGKEFAFSEEQPLSQGQVYIDKVEIFILETFPVKVLVAVTGGLPDSCTVIKNIQQEKQEDGFFIKIITSRPTDSMCAQIIKPFKEVISLDVIGLKQGRYEVNVHGVKKTFELMADNIMESHEQ